MESKFGTWELRIIEHHLMDMEGRSLAKVWPTKQSVAAGVVWLINVPGVDVRVPVCHDTLEAAQKEVEKVLLGIDVEKRLINSYTILPVEMQPNALAAMVVVAKAGGAKDRETGKVIDWAAYALPVLRGEVPPTVAEVSEHGDKLPCDVAEGLFPAFKRATIFYRD